MRHYYLGTSERTHSRGYRGGVCLAGSHGFLLSYKKKKKHAESVVLLLKPWQTWAPTRLCAHTPYIAPSISSIWLFLNCIMYNKLTLESEVPSWVLFGISSELSILDKGPWEPLDFTAGQRDIWLAEDLNLASEVGAILWD